MNFYIPELGDQIKLTKDWSFPLYSEGRNETLGETFGYLLIYNNKTKNWIPYDKNIPTPEGYQIYYDIHKNPIYFYKDVTSTDYHWWRKVGEEDTHIIQAVLPAGTILKIDRIYVRKGNKDFSSVSFYVTSKEKVKRTGKPIRFWAKLSDCNTIEFEPVK